MAAMTKCIAKKLSINWISSQYHYMRLLRLLLLMQNQNVGQCPTWWSPAEYRWRPLFNAAKFGWHPLLWLTPTTRVPCSNAAKTRKPWKFEGVSQTRQQISAVSRPKFTILQGPVEEVSVFNKFFLIVDTCLSCEDRARQRCAMVPKWWFFASCIFSEPRAAHFRHAF